MLAVAQQTEPTASSSLADEIKLVAVPPQMLERLWSVLAPRFDDVLRRAPGLTLEAMVRNIAGGQWQLWMAWRDNVGPAAIAGTELVRNDDGSLMCSVLFCTGDGAREFSPLLVPIENWARSEGCTRMKAVTRKGWARHLTDYKMTHVVLEKDL